MKTIHKHIRKHLLDSVSFNNNQRLPGIAELQKTEWHAGFEQLMRNRLIMGAFRYGRLNAPGKPKFDCMECIIQRSMQYKETGNTECLVDIANLALIEYVEGIHPKKHFNAVDDNIHARKAEE